MNKFNQYLDTVNENYKISIDRNTQITKEKIDIVFYKKNKKNILIPLKKILISKNTVLVNPKKNLQDFIYNKTKTLKLNQVDFIQIFMDDTDNYGLLIIKDSTNMIQKIVNSLITGIPMFKNK
jgi:hypothetical protein